MAIDTRAGVGKSSSRDSFAAGRDAASRAKASLEGAPASLVIVFATAGHDQSSVLRGVAEVTGSVPLTGCSAEGVIDRDGSDESSHAVVVAAIASERMRFSTFSMRGLSDDSFACGARLASLVAASGSCGAGGLLLLFPDGITGDVGDLIRGVESRLPADITIAGGTAGDLLTFQRTFQYHDGVAFSDGVAAVLVSGAVADIAVTHGCDLVGQLHTITRAERGFVHEIDGRPAWDVFKSYLDEGTADTLEAMHVTHLVVAERLPDAPSSSDFGEFAVRVPVKLDKSTGAVFFPAGMKTGTVVQLALRNADVVCERATAAAKQILSRHGGRPPDLMLQLDCAGRGRLLFGPEVTERVIAPVQRPFGDAPWIGLHTYGEIAPVGGRTYFHNYTGVLCALYATAS